MDFESEAFDKHVEEYTFNRCLLYQEAVSQFLKTPVDERAYEKFIFKVTALLESNRTLVADRIAREESGAA